MRTISDNINTVLEKIPKKRFRKPKNQAQPQVPTDNPTDLLEIHKILIPRKKNLNRFV